MQVEELLGDWKNVCKLKKSSICRFKKYPIKFLQIEEPFTDQRIVWRPKDYSIGRLKNDLQIKKVFNLQFE